MQKWIQKNGFGDDQALLEYAFALSTQYGEAIGALACDMYEKIAEAQGVTIPPAEMADTPEFGEVAKAVYGTMKESLNKVNATVGRLVKQTGADTMLKNAKRDGAYFAWVAHGDTCPYCLMLSAIGWQKAGKNTIRGKHADHIHPHCDCQYVVDFKGDLKVEGYDPEKMQQKIMDIVDPDEEKYWGNFDYFLNANGRQTWASKGRDNTDMRILRRELAAKKSASLNVEIAKKELKTLSVYHMNPNDDALERVKKAKPIDGYEDFAIHGAPEQGKVVYESTNGQNVYFSAREYADIIREEPTYKGGDIRLLSCGMGNEKNGFAKELAEILGRNVLAPTETLHVGDNGELFITDYEWLADLWYNDGKVDYSFNQTGYWKNYEP
ncbi:MAG: hypothetical protein MJ117_00350 [Lachnospiraceae bacterium]|nr:hypothetical protein [Lachnospiraceae bacterium]